MTSNDIRATDDLRKRRKFLWIGLGAVAAALVLAASVSALYLAFGRPIWETQPLGVTLTDFNENVSVEEDTETLCAVVSCEEGWRTSVGNYLLFDTDDQAEYGRMVAGGDAIRNGNIVLDRNGLELTELERSISVDMLFPGHDWF
ncbi:hypothetical protein OHB93_10905 [Microbacterium sp. No. 7]|uniref:hypothetical protein n=1 Tax=Microbacterium sp. No. 7 TaxID=1714373 RepID=UPI00300B976E